jgi:hypothetical protein
MDMMMHVAGAREFGSEGVGGDALAMAEWLGHQYGRAVLGDATGDDAKEAST